MQDDSLSQAGDVPTESTVEFKNDKTYIADAGTPVEAKGTWPSNSAGTISTLNPENEDSSDLDVLSGSASVLKVKLEEDYTAFADFFGIELEEELLLVFEVTLTK